MGESIEIRLKEVPEHGSLFGFEMGMIVASFQLCEMTFLFSAVFKSWVKYWIAIGSL